MDVEGLKKIRALNACSHLIETKHKVQTSSGNKAQLLCIISVVSFNNSYLSPIIWMYPLQKCHQKIVLPLPNITSSSSQTKRIWPGKIQQPRASPKPKQSDQVKSNLLKTFFILKPCSFSLQFVWHSVGRYALQTIDWTTDDRWF